MTDYYFEIVNSTELQHLRDMQIKELRGTAQDGTEEGIVTYGANFIKIMNNKKISGYACIGTYDFYKDMILEYYLISEYRVDSADIIKQLIKKYKCTKWLVNTHDFFTFPIMLDLQFKYAIDAYKFAIDDSVEIKYELGSELSIEVTTSYEVHDVYQLIMQDGFYTGGNLNSLSPLIAAKEIYSLRRNDRLIGVGFVGVSKRTPSYADIAMIIDKKNRLYGYGVLLVKVLIDNCRLLNLIPTAVCDVKNLASRKTLQKAGFHLDGCLLLAKIRSFNTIL